MAKVIAVGNYGEADLAALKETFDPVFLDTAVEIEGLPGGHPRRNRRGGAEGP